MKKVMTNIGLILFTSFFLASCASSIESDAKKYAELQCKAQKLMESAGSGDLSAINESTSLAAEASSLSSEFQKKYTSDSDKEKFSEALLKAMGKCD